MKRKPDSQGSGGVKPKVAFQRNFEHVDGNWPSHVYLDGPYHKLRNISQSCLAAATSPSGSPIPVVPIEKPHLSVSRPFVLRHHQISHFVNRLGELIEHFQCLSVRVESAYYLLQNDAGIREFVALPVNDTRGKLKLLVKLVDEVLLSFKQPAYYENPFFHISIGSRLPAEASPVVSSALPALHIVHSAVGSTYSSGQAEDSSEDEDGGTPSWLRGSSADVLGEASGVQAVVAVKQAGSSISEAAGGMLGGLLVGYDSDSDSSSGGRIEKCNGNIEGGECTAVDVPLRSRNGSASESAPVPLANVPALSAVLTFTAVMCKIGNRAFRMDLLPLTGDGSKSGSAARHFVECAGET